MFSQEPAAGPGELRAECQQGGGARVPAAAAAVPPRRPLQRQPRRPRRHDRRGRGGGRAGGRQRLHCVRLALNSQVPSAVISCG